MSGFSSVWRRTPAAPKPSTRPSSQSAKKCSTISIGMMYPMSSPSSIAWNAIPTSSSVSTSPVATTSTVRRAEVRPAREPAGSNVRVVRTVSSLRVSVVVVVVTEPSESVSVGLLPP